MVHSLAVVAGPWGPSFNIWSRSRHAPLPPQEIALLIF